MSSDRVFTAGAVYLRRNARRRSPSGVKRQAGGGCRSRSPLCLRWPMWWACWQRRACL